MSKPNLLYHGFHSSFILNQFKIPLLCFLPLRGRSPRCTHSPQLNASHTSLKHLFCLHRNINYQIFCLLHGGIYRHKLLRSFHETHCRNMEKFHCLMKCEYFISALKRFLPLKLWVVKVQVYRITWKWKDIFRDQTSKTKQKQTNKQQQNNNSSNNKKPKWKTKQK